MRNIYTKVFKKIGFILAVISIVIVSTVLQVPEPLSAA